MRYRLRSSLIILTLIYYFVYQANLLDKNLLFNSDAVYVRLYAEDLILHRSPERWLTPQVPFYFPDLLLQILLLPLDRQVAFFMIGLIQILSLTIITSFLIKRLSLSVWILFFTYFLTSPFRLWYYFYTPVRHLGALTIALIAILLSFYNSKYSRFNLALISFLCFVTAYSDWLFILWYPIPLCIYWLLHHRPPKYQNQVYVSVISCLAAFILNKITYNDWVLTSSFLNTSYLSIKVGLTNFYTDLHSLNFFTLSLITFTFILTFTYLYRKRHNFIHGSIFILLLVTLTMVIFFGRYQPEFITIHYLAPFAWVMAAYSGLYRRWLSPILFGLLILGIIHNLGQKTLSFQFEYNPPLVSCLNTHQNQFTSYRGVSQYWLANQTTFLTNSQFNIIASLPEIKPYYWMRNDADYDLPPSFFIFDYSPYRPLYVRKMDLDPARLELLQGKPSSIITCATYAFWLYN